MTGSFRKLGAKLVDNGFAIIPIEVGTKGPKTEGWQERFAKDRATYDRMARENDADCGIGIVTRDFPAVDIDCKDEQVVRRMVAWLKDNLGEAPERIGSAPKTLLVYRTDEPFFRVASAAFRDPENPEFNKDGKPKGQRLEVLANGQQFVAYHVHPETGKEYEWPNDWENPVDMRAEDLQLITVDHAVAACREFERLCTSLGWTKLDNGSYPRDSEVDENDALAEEDPPEETEAEIARVKSALAAITKANDDGVSAIDEYSYDQWRNLLFSLKWTRWECAEQLAREASEASKWHVTKTFNTVWRGAQKRDRGREVTLASLYGMAKAAGWDASRASSDNTAQVEDLKELIDGLEFEKDTQSATQKIIAKMAELQLSAIAEDELLKAIKKQTGFSVATMRRDVTRARKKHVAEVDHMATHAGYSRKLIETLEDKAGVRPVGVEGMIYTYDDEKKIWVGTQTMEFAVQVANMFDGQENCSRRSDYTAVASHAYSILANGKEDFFAKAPIGLACTGRFYKVNREGEIEREELDHTHRQRVLSPVKPIKGEMPMFEKFLAETFAGDEDNEQINLLQEIMGATMLGMMARYEKVVLFKGYGRSGKGTTLKIIEAILPPEFCSAVSPFRWDGEYYLANLAGKRLNVVGELPSDEPIPAAEFKTVTGRDRLTGRHPGQKPFTFRNEATHIFNSNYFVYTRDHSEAFYTRWLLMEFRNTLIEREDDQEIDLAEKIIDAELPAICAWALQGAKRLEDRGYFLRTKTHQKLMFQWRHRTSPLMEFLLDPEVCVIGDPKTHFVRRSTFYQDYVRWCKDSNRKPLGKLRLYDELDSQGIIQLGVRKGTDASGIDILRGVRMSQGVWENLDEEEL